MRFCIHCIEFLSKFSFDATPKPVDGCYLHWGYESSWPDAHHPVLNTAFQHYAHHARAIIGKPYHCGFFLKCWDQLFGSTYDGPCFCVKCEKKNGRRTREIFDTIEIPNYSKLLQLRFWMQGGVLSGALSEDVNEDVKQNPKAPVIREQVASFSESAKEGEWAVSQKQ